MIFFFFNLFFNDSHFHSALEIRKRSFFFNERFLRHVRRILLILFKSTKFLTDELLN